MPGETIHYGYRLLLMALIIVTNGFFAAAETALVSVRPSRLRQMAGEGLVGAQAALSLLSNPERLLSVVQVGVTLTSLALGWVGEETLYGLLMDGLRPVITPATQAVLRGFSLVFAFVLMTFAHVVIGEVVPKNFAIDRADRFAVLAAPVLLVFYKMAEPLVWIIERASMAISSAIGIRGSLHAGSHSPEELKMIVHASGAAGYMTKFEADSIDRILELPDYVVREVMVPRNSLVMIPVDADLDEVLRVMSESRYSRVPVYEGDRERILGIVHGKDILEFWYARRQANQKRRSVPAFQLRRVVRQVPFVPETKPLTQVLDELRSKRAHVAFVVDEYGTVTGFLSAEDFFEHIFGEIEDEFDLPRTIPVEEGEPVEVEGTISLVDLEDNYGFELPSEEGYETLAGFLLFRLGHIPKVGEAVVHGERRFLVTEMQFNRIARVLIQPLLEPEEVQD